MKTCTKCGEEKSLDSFGVDKWKKSGYTSRCKDCMAEVARLYRASNPEKSREITKKYRELNSDKEKARYNRYNQENPQVRANLSAKRRASKLNATPSWANLEQIKRIYAACANITEKTGIEHHVDHIIPLQGENVCGLHVENNLAIIPAKMNLQKSNKY